MVVFRAFLVGSALMSYSCRRLSKLLKGVPVLNLASLVKTAKRYAFNTSISNVELINAVLEPYVDAAGVKARGGADFYLDKHRTSKILNGEAEVPLALRRVNLQHGLEGRVAAECAVLFDETIDPSLFEGLKEDVLSLVNGDGARQAQIRCRLAEKDSPEGFFAAALVGAIGEGNLRNDGDCIWKKGSGSLCWRSGDLFRFGFGNRRKARNLVVIPVDRSFNMHVTRNYEGVDVKEISERSVHGQWLSRMALSGVLENEVKERVEAALCASGFERDETGLYPLGAVAAIDARNATYLLLAISKFNEKGMAEATKEDIEACLISLLRYYDENGQGADLYLPLIGTGLSRSRLDKAEAFELIRNVVTEQSSFVGGKVTIVLLPEDAVNIGMMRQENL